MSAHFPTEEAQIIVTYANSNESEILFNGSNKLCQLELIKQFEKEENGRWINEASFEVNSIQGDLAYTISLVCGIDRIGSLVGVIEKYDS